jgi:hypothetical protein
MSAKQKLFGIRMLKSKYELLPLVSFLSAACAGGMAFMAYSLYQKPDVRVNKWTEHPPWERVNPETPQKLITINQIYERNPQLEDLRREIGSYKS